MNLHLILTSLIFTLALVAGPTPLLAQAPPSPPPGDFPKPLPPEGKKNAKKKPADPLHHPEKKGVKPPMPVMPPTPEPTAPDEPGL